MVYRAEGVCDIVDIRKECFGANPQGEEYYILSPRNDANSSIYVPVYNEALTAQMRSLLSREEIAEMLCELRDVVQLSNDEGRFYHTLIISGFTDNDILVCAHSDDALDRPLSSYNYAGIRILHIEGARLNFDTDTSFNDLINGVALKP